MATERDPLLGTVFAERYRIERRLGSGGMGCVYAATQLSMSREVALKVLNPGLNDSKAAVQRFEREMKASSKVEHPNTIRVYDFGESADGRLFLAMEMLPGKTLHQVLCEAGVLDTGRLLRIAEQIARALGAAHSEGIIHRDLKPENVMLIDKYGERDQVRVLDFGIARFAEGGVEHGEPTLTRAGTLIGTPLYMSPEQALGKPVDHRSDLYALGVLLYQMSTGTVPFSAETPVRVLFMHANDEVKAPSSIAKGRVPARLEALILSLLAKSPDDRPQDAADVITALRSVGESATLIESDGLVHADSRLQSQTKISKARSAFHDPASQVPTSNSVRIDSDVDVLMQTAAAMPAARVAEIVVADEHPNVEDSGAMTYAHDQQAIEMAETGEIANVVLDTSLPTLESEMPFPLASSAAVSSAGGASALPQTPALTANPPPPQDTASITSSSAPTLAGSSAAPTTLASPQSPEGSGGQSTKIAIIVALALALVLIGAYVLSRSPTSTPTQNSATRPSDIKSADVTEHIAKPELPDPAIAARAALRAAHAKAGEPDAAERCSVTDAATIVVLTDAVTQMTGGRPRGRRPADKAAAKALAAIKGPQAKSAEVLANLARAKLLAGESDPSIITIAKSARISCPSMALAWEVEGTVHLLSMRAKVATEMLGKAVELAPSFQRARYNLGLAQLSSGLAAAALATFKEVQRREPKRPGVMTGIGQAHIGAKDYPKAIAALKEATSRAPKNASTWYLLGMAHKFSGDAAKAMQAWCVAAKLGHPRAGRKCPDAAGIPVPK